MTASTSPDFDVIRNRLIEAVRAHWKLLLIEGILMIVLGLLAVALPIISTLAVTILVGWLFVIGGIFRLIASIRTRTRPGFWWSLLTSVLEIVAGVLLLVQPIQGMLTLTIVLIALFILEGIATITLALRFRGRIQNWGWTLLSGIIDLVLAFLIWAGWPATAAWAIGLLVGINMAFLGFSVVMIALGARYAGGPADRQAASSSPA